MRTFGAPKSYEMRRERVEAMDAMRRFVKDAWEASGGDVKALWASSRHPKEVVDTELLPAARCVACPGRSGKKPRGGRRVQDVGAGRPGG